MGRGSRLAAIAAFVFVTVTVPAGAAAGGSGVGDPFFHHAGNGGYTVQNYDLTLRYDPPTRHLDGHARISASATEQLTRFDLDLRGLTVSSVKVNGASASFRRAGQELIITPAAVVPDGSHFSVDVDYAGTPGPVIDPDGSNDGWIPTDDGAFVAGEPQGSPTWYPANDTPSDKARFTISMTVPQGITAVGNGALESQVTSNGWTTFVWHEGRPMATYLATITLGQFNVTQRTAGGIPVYIAVDPREAQGAARAMSRIPKIIKFEQSVLGPYPFETVGAIVDHDAGAGYALETQTKPVYDGAPGAETVAHELAHQWFGDSVSLETWPDIWMNEGFATYVQWMYNQYRGGAGPGHFFHLVMSIPADSGFWCVAPNALPGPKWLFAGTVYIRGAATLQALRNRIGDGTFLRLLRTWASDHRYSNGTSAEFEALAAQLSGQDLTAFFDRWLRTPGRPGDQPGSCSATQLSAALAGSRH